MQDNFVDRFFSFLWLVIKTGFLGFLSFVETMKQNYGLQTGGFILVSTAAAVWFVLAYSSFSQRGGGGAGFFSFIGMLLITATEGIFQLFAIGCMLAGMAFLGWFYL